MSEALFRTRRLRCRRWRRSDLEPMYAVYADPLAVRWVGDGTPITREGCEEWLAITARNYERRGYGMFALEEIASGRVVGFCGLVHPGGQDEPEIKYAFMRDQWGKGLASEAVAALLSYGARVHGLRRVIATVAPENLPSQRVLAKAGARLAQLRSNEDGSTTQVYEWRSPEPDAGFV